MKTIPGALKGLVKVITEIGRGDNVMPTHNPKSKQRTSGQITIDGGVPLTDGQLRTAREISEQRKEKEV